MSPITTIGFDADDTLWRNEHVFKVTEARFAAMLSSHGEAEDISSRLLAAEKRNLSFYGFMLSMIETAIEVTDGNVPASVIGNILAAGREMLRHPVETLPHARATLEALAGGYRLILITKGDLFDQERKLAQSGLGELFDAIEIVSDKNVSTYQRVFARHGDGAPRAMMVGNSLRSDVLPAIEAGSFGVHVPHDLIWDFEHAEAPHEAARFRRIEHLGELEGLLAQLR
jgi:putative hydrolase of the HAD superfamily